VDSSLRPQLIDVAAGYDQRLRAGSKAIFHLEAFVARFMSFYKAFLSSMMFD
jgi:replication factor C subunit 3/5